MVDLNPRREKHGRTGKLTPLEQRFYSATPRYEENMKRACGRSVIMLRSDIATSLSRGLEDLQHDYETARADSTAQGRQVSELEARFGAALVLVHLQVLSKVNELEELAVQGTPVVDIRRLADNLSALIKKLAEIEAAASVATTGDLNEEERNKIRFYDVKRFARVAEAVQLRRETVAAGKRLNEGLAAGDDNLVQRARVRLDEIRHAAERLREEADLGRELQLDQMLKQIFAGLQ